MTTDPTTSPTPSPSLDRALAAWATTAPAGAGDEAALARILGHADRIATPAPTRRPIWMVGGAIAASVAVALLLAPRPGMDAPQAPTGSPVILADASPDSSAAFALLYTPTSEEEYQL